MCQAIIGATPTYSCPAGYTLQSAGCVSTATGGASLQALSTSYFHTDHLGSITAATDEMGAVVERMAYDAWGKRRFTNGTADRNDTIVGLTTDRGYTEHEELDEIGVIHMNGRIYDPYIGRFMSADPYIQAPYELQSHNRYAYVMNNPLLYTDPSGFNWFKKLVVAVVIIVAVVVTMGAAAYAIAGAGVFSGGFMAGIASVGAASLGNAMIIGAAGGFVGGFLGASLNGASFSESLKAGVIGGITGAAMAWAGGIGGAGGSNTAGRYLAHAAVGCGSSLASGGGASGCGRGAAAALIGHAVTNYSAGQGDVARFAAASVSGGVTSRIMGGSFANGATTAAYGYLFNEMLHRDWGGSNEQRLKNSGYKETTYPDGTYCNTQNSPSCTTAFVDRTYTPEELATRAGVFDAAKLGVSMHPVGRLGVGILDGSQIAIDTFNGNYKDASITGSGMVVSNAAEKVLAAKGFPVSQAPKFAAGVGTLWERSMKYLFGN